MFATVFNYTAFHKRYDDNYAGIAIPAFFIPSFPISSSVLENCSSIFPSFLIYKLQNNFRYIVHEYWWCNALGHFVPKL